ncbi:phosphoribosylanthranilate isomerase [Sulfurisphaera tokodaii]|uniref:N-(5'-phosphoribosyl)anthranilate isomerase n=2 Tax=Sulfurisphaera tokodaii TaxID=111955 RepID=F9VNY3_SULTO|nr:phosphoribosylanthranilate isomerase [Sulfurisphaera tokodaii]BAK54491.1 N- (5'-phosphoribosyl) anthranilate isomerase [Sulfurisphaera tokodaii str. 7]HII73252.1 phosphoribosylanthranilate isomerase [Sulfurisphaera tokodaii]
MIKIKFCGISHIEDAIVASNYADLIGVVTDPISPRFVKPEFIDIVKNFVNKPVVNVKVKGKINDIVNESKAEYVQIHRVLDMEEIEDILSYNKKFILYVPSSEKYYSYFKTIVNKTNHLILIDSEKKGEKVNLEVSKIWIKEYDKVGIGGGITLNNIEEFLSLNPYWIDISSGIEKYKSKKDHDKMIRIAEKVKEWKSIL